jgi:glycosyltransferase involved in cell wall biosynthesis
MFRQIPMVVTCMSMALPTMLPKTVPTTFGTPALLQQARETGRSPLALILPPVDVRKNAPGAVDARSFRKQWAINAGDITLVTVSRLVNWMKAESLRRTIEVVRMLGRELPLRFVIVGDGTARKELALLASRTNAELGRPAVVLTGAMLDPRPAYAAADIIVGMGGSALRGMAFAKPVVVVGEDGFSAPFTRDTSDFFYQNGIYGVGDGDKRSVRLAADITRFAQFPRTLGEIGDFSRRFVLQHFSLEEVAGRLDEFFRVAAGQTLRFPIAAADGIRTASFVLGRTIALSGVRRLFER